MADNVDFQAVLATPVAGTKVSTEEVTTLNGGAVPAQHVQRMVPAFRTSDGVANDLPGDTTNGLDVDVTRLPTSGTATRTSVGDEIADTQLLAANAARKQVIIVNESDADLYVALGAAASTTDYTFFLPKQYGGQKSQLELPLPVYTGAIRGIWSSNAGGNARITELT